MSLSVSLLGVTSASGIDQHNRLREGAPSDSAMPDGITIITDRLGHLARCWDDVT